MASDDGICERTIRSEWTLPDDVTYLNHGSFGPSPRVVQRARIEWIEQLECQPMNFLVRRMEDAVEEASARVAEFVGADPRDLVFVENATVAMNIVANSFELQPDDEVLTTDHEYGAVMRIWQTRCRQQHAKLVVRRLPEPLESVDEIVETLFAGVTERTRLILVSHVTSPTATILPLEAIVSRAQSLDIPVCVDGPHALGVVPVELRRFGCDFYTASCHKWLSAPFGSGFLYVRRDHQKAMRPLVISWGRNLSGQSRGWRDEFLWAGTRDPAAFLATPTAIRFLEDYGLEHFRHRTHELARYARHRIAGLTKLEPPIPDEEGWYGSMVTLPLPALPDGPIEPYVRDPLQQWLWDQHRIEVPVLQWHGQRYIRVSCHLYNDATDIERLVDALGEGLNREVVDQALPDDF